jgi:Ca-activated chloride channel family protein
MSIGCGSASAITTNGGGNQAFADGADAPPHVFTARTHPPRVRQAPVAPDIAAMPRLVERSTSCFGSDRDDEKVVRKKVTGKSKGKGSSVASKKSGFVPYNPTPGSSPPKSPTKPKPVVAQKKPSKSSPAPATPEPATTTPSQNAPVADEAMDDRSPMGGAEQLPSEAPTDASGSSARQEERESPRSKRDRNRKDKRRSGDKALASSPPAMEEPASFVAAPDPDDAFDDWGRSTYLSNDDSMSLSSAQRVIYAIDRFLPLPIEHIRPHELLNYFSFATTPVAETDDFSVNAELAADPDKPGIYSLALAVQGRPLDRESRRNTALTFVVDRSGSMADEGRMDFLKQGMRRMLEELKTGDMVHIVLFDDQVCTPIENFVVGRDPRRMLETAIDKIQPRGSTDVNLGLQTGYAIADRTFQPNAGNRVVLITDAIANTGVTDEESIAIIGKHYDSRRIRLSGIGVGSDFNDSLLDKLTERGHGAYMFLGSPAEVDAVFGNRFVSLIENVADDVHFQLHLPPSLRMNVFYGEESSSVKEDVQAIHYFANTSQLFLTDLMARGGKLRPQDSVMLTIEYQDPETGDAMVEEFAFPLSELQAGRNVAKGRMLIDFIDGLAAMATRPLPSAWSQARESWADPDAFEMCQQGRDVLAKSASGLHGDPEVTRVTGLWDRYCTRFSRPSGAVRRASPEQGWPAANGR